MKSQIVTRLRTASQRSAVKNLECFIAAVKGAIPFPNIEWPESRWVLTSTGRSSSSHQVVGLVFARLSDRPKSKSIEPFPEPFDSFVKAVVCKRAQRRVSPISPSSHAVMVRACRYLFESLAPRARTPVELTAADFESAARHARKRESGTTIYVIGNMLEEVSRLIDEQGITPVPIGWVNTIKRADSHGGAGHSRIGALYDARRAKKLLSEAVLDALGYLSSKSDLSDQDLLCQRAIDILVCAPFRINELLTLPRDVWVEDIQNDDQGNPVIGQDGKPKIHYGLRYWPEKGGHTETQIKWLPTAMVDVARRAVADIVRITQPFADIAEVIYTKQGHTRLGSQWDGLSASQCFLLIQVSEVVGLRGKNRKSSALSFLKTHKIAYERISSPDGRSEVVVRKGDIEGALGRVSRAGNMFRRRGPIQPLFKGLFVVGVNFFGNRPLLNGTARPVTDQAISMYVCGRADAKSVFDRYQYTDSAGNKVKATTHQFRHWLNTLALEGGLPEHVVARWSGRKRIADNAAYDHVSGFQMARQIREKLAAGQAIGAVPNYVREIRDPVDRSEFINTLVTTAHLTDLGGCLHDMSMDPCNQHGACASCPEHVIRKGDPIQKSRARDLLRDTRALVARAEAELAEGSYGANNWLMHHQRIASSLEKISAIHDNPDIPDGTVVYLDRITTNVRSRKATL